MATSYHQEARTKQARLDRWNDQKKRAELGPQAQDAGKEKPEDVSYKQKMDRVLITDPGQFESRRPATGARDVQFETGVIFERVVHDANFNFRMGKALGRTPLHVNPIYKIMHPLPMFRVNEEGYNNRYRNRQHLVPHVDCAFAVLYPGSDFSDYAPNDNVVNRRLNRWMDKYEISKKVNGEFRMQLAEGSERLAVEESS